MMFLKHSGVALVCCLQLAYATPVAIRAKDGPVVDLGYELHKGTVNETGQYFNFSNVRYAAAPTGKRRFSPPTAPAKPTGDAPVNDGSTGVICPQGLGEWFDTATEFLTGQNITHKGSNYSDYGLDDIPPVDPRTTEDCLFLDILTPKKVFNSVSAKATREANDGAPSYSTGAPVLVWIHGGGFVSGYKDLAGTGTGLIERSLEDDAEGIVYVAINYRLGLFGFLGGKSFEEGKGIPNAGLLDQRFALEWIQENIHLFGGDPNRVTIMGESAGGGSVMYQMAAYDGSGKVPFAEAIAQSPFSLPSPTRKEQEAQFNQVLDMAKVSSLPALRSVSSKKLQTVNTLMNGRSDYGGFIFGPVIDGDFVSDELSNLFTKGKFQKNVNVMVGHNSDEGILFASPYVTGPKTFEAYLSRILISLPDSTVTDLATKIFPRDYDGSEGYKDLVGRVAASYGDLTINCHTRVLETAMDNQLYSYEFSVPPGWHGNDQYYTFFNGNAVSTIQGTKVWPGLAHKMQRSFVNFAMSGSPNGPLPVAEFPVYGDERTVFNFNITNFGPKADDVDVDRCDWWQQTLLDLYH